MRFILLLLATLFCHPEGTFAQVPFAPVGPSLVSHEVAFDQANEVYLYFQNLAPADTLLLHWRRLEVDTPPGWDIDLCDLGTCYIGIPGNALMNPATGDQQAYLKLIVQPGQLPGAAWLAFRIYEEGHAQDNFVDVYFSLYTPGTTAAGEPATAALRVFPNPARDVLFVENSDTQPRSARLLTSQGRVVWSGILPPNERSVIPLAGLPAGPYFLQTADTVRKILVEK